MEVAGCRGDLAITCNNVGTSYDLIQCERGCDLASGGCRLCEPDQTACTNGTLATCDASGAVVASQRCPLGCFEDQPRCRDIDPSNGLGRFFDMVPDPPDLDLTAGGSISASGVVLRNSEIVAIPNFLVPAPPNGVAIRVFVVRSARLGDVRVGDFGSEAIAILASDDIELIGRIAVAPGRIALPSCAGSPGIVIEESGPAPRQSIAGGGGGGGFATPGARGGDVMGRASGGTGGAASGTAELVPLRGGCSGGSLGGGALQLSSRTSILVHETIDADGDNGEAEQVTSFGGAAFGGGGGGALLLEAPSVTLGSNAKLLVRGGGGGSAGPPPPRTDGGIRCTSTVWSATRRARNVAA
jgi:hypothetical protein